jgi:hypothetical protein
MSGGGDRRFREEDSVVVLCCVIVVVCGRGLVWVTEGSVLVVDWECRGHG